MKLLVPVDGSEVALRALEYAVALARDGLQLRIHLLNVQSPLSADVARFIARDVIDEHHQEHGSAALADGKGLLEAAGIAYEATVAVGSTAQTIVASASSKGCDGIVMGTSGAGSMAGMLLGSTASKVMQLTERPLTLVR